MTFCHERLDVYQLSISYIAQVYSKASSLGGHHRHARDQWFRASQSISLNIAEGNGKATVADRRRYFEIARGSALECAAIQDVLTAGKGLGSSESQKMKVDLDRIVAMLSKLGGRGYQVKESLKPYGGEANDYTFDPDSDTDSDTDLK